MNDAISRMSLKSFALGSAAPPTWSLPPVGLACGNRSFARGLLAHVSDGGALVQAPEMRSIYAPLNCLRPMFLIT